MPEIISINQILIIAVTNVISGIFLGLGIAIGMYQALKKQMPKWIHELTFELKKISMMDKALEYQQQNK